MKGSTTFAVRRRIQAARPNMKRHITILSTHMRDRLPPCRSTRVVAALNGFNAPDSRDRPAPFAPPMWYLLDSRALYGV